MKKLLIKGFYANNAGSPTISINGSRHTKDSIVLSPLRSALTVVFYPGL
jgi:hypothetical protein